MSNHEASPIQTTKSGSGETSTKRIKTKQGKIREVEAEVTHDGKVIYSDEEGQKEYSIDNYQDYNVALGMCQTEKLEGFEVDEKFFDILVQGKETPFLITGNPSVKVFRKGTMDKQLKILSLSISKMNELRAKQAREKAELKRKAEDEITSL